MATFFAPQLILRNVADGIDFYRKAFGAVVLRKWDNDDGSTHVAELEIDGAMFHLHQESPHSNQYSPQIASVIIGLFVEDPYSVEKSAIQYGAQIVSPVQDYDYGYRQGTFTDPFGHQWMVEKRI